jgi:hypothetical protein
VTRVSPSRPICAALAVAGFLFFAISCAVPLAPQYQIVRQTFEVRFVTGANPQIKFHNVYTLQNTGNADLDFIDVVFPVAKIYGRSNLSVESGGRPVVPVDLPLEYQQDSPGALRLQFGSRWPQKEKRDLTIDYSFSPPAAGGQQFSLSAQTFHLGARGWLPAFLPPNHILAATPTRPEKLSYTVRVPSDFAVLARGSTGSRKQDGSDTIYRFDLDKRDLGPYIVAGRYAGANQNKKSSGAVFWTLKESQQNSSPQPDHFASAWLVLQKNFGAIDKRGGAPYMVEAPSLEADVNLPGGAGFAAFPGGVLINPAGFDLRTDNEVFTERVERGLARTWFDDALQPAPFAAVAIGDGLPNYATIVIDEAAGGPSARRKRIIELLNSYDEARGQLKAPEKSVAATVPTDSPEQHRIAEAKAPLLFAVLEDTCGATPVRAGLAQVIQLLRGKEVSVNDVRAAIEYTTAKNLAEPFRVWLYNLGIPSDFRARYAAADENRKEKIRSGN